MNCRQLTKTLYHKYNKSQRENRVVLSICFDILTLFFEFY